MTSDFFLGRRSRRPADNIIVCVRVRAIDSGPDFHRWAQCLRS